MKNDVYQPTATDNLTSDENVEIQIRDKGSSISVVWRFVMLILFFLVIALMVALIIVSKKVAGLKATQCLQTTIAPDTTANTG
jgi:cell division protein FtsL